MSDLRAGAGLLDRLSTVVELITMLRENRRWWAIPAFLLLAVLGLVLVGLHAVPYFAPFIYAVF